MPPHQTSIITRVLETQPTYHGLGRQGTHYKEDSMTQVKLKSSCLFLSSALITYSKSRRWKRYRKYGSIELPSKLDLITLLFDSPLGLGIYNHAFLPSASPRGANGDLVLPAGNTAIFETALSITV
jgi:hypothetical protein